MPVPDWGAQKFTRKECIPSLPLSEHGGAESILDPTPRHVLQSDLEKETNTLAYKEMFAPTCNYAMTTEEQNAAIRIAFYEDDTMPKEKELESAIGKTQKMLVQPRKEALQHAAASLIKSYATEGCPADCGPDWTKEHIEAALLKGPHSSATKDDALRALVAETKEKVANGYAKVLRYGDIIDNLPKKLKVSPVAMIPHKSRYYRTILDLSFRLRHKGKLLESVNSATVKLAPAESMIQLGNCIQRLVALLADNYDPDQPFLFAKLDIKDGFWRMAVNEEDAWNFCYVLPTNNPNCALEDIEIVVPNCLQMGWCESPPFFCAASETARDVIEALLLESQLPSHPFEDEMLSSTNISIAANRLQATAMFTNLVEVFVDDFIAATNSTDFKHLQHFSRAMLFGVHSIFPPPEISGHQGEDPISQKKLQQGDGSWTSTKEILGWLIDGANFTLQLLPEKCTIIAKLIKKLCKQQHCSLLKFQELAGKLQHASFGIPGGKGLFSPIHRALRTKTQSVTLTPYLKATLKDWRTLVQHMGTNPTPVQVLVSNYPNYIQYTDACALGAGGVITPGLDPMQYWVWQYEWPDDIKKELVTSTNRTGKITINDLELAGIVIGWLVLEYVCDDLVFKHIGMFCDNTSAVAWAYKYTTSKSIIAGRLLRLLAIRQRTRQASSLLPLHIAGEDNEMADIPSRAFKNGEFFHAHENLVNYFNSHFPLPKNLCWKEYKVKQKLVSRVISCLRGTQLPMESLHKLPKLGKNIGAIGQNTASFSNLDRTLMTSQLAKNLSSSQDLPQGYAPGLTVTEIKLAFKRSRTRSRPSPRPANWLENKVPSSKKRENTFFPSKDLSKDSKG